MKIEDFYLTCCDFLRNCGLTFFGPGLHAVLLNPKSLTICLILDTEYDMLNCALTNSTESFICQSR